MKERYEVLRVIFPCHLGEDFRFQAPEGCRIVLFEGHLTEIRPEFAYHKLKLAWNEAICRVFIDDNKDVGLIMTLKELRKAFKDSIRVEIFDPLDHDTLDRMVSLCPCPISVLPLKTSFFLDEDSLQDTYKMFAGKKRLSHKMFFKSIKERFGILVDVETTDQENRKSIKALKNKKIPGQEFVNRGTHALICKRAIENVNKNFSHNPGDASQLMRMPVDRVGARAFFLREFIDKRLSDFGAFEDALDVNDSVLFHSNCSHLLNAGLLSPRFVVEAVLRESTEMNNVEGFVRQVLGWREYMRFIYHFWGRDLKKRLIDSPGKRLDFKAWYAGTTGLVPIDNEISKCQSRAWAHHIVRLMIFMNFMIISDIRAYDIYEWFSTFVSLDAQEWVMVSNIAAMGYFDRRFMSRAYVSSSNYVLKMSNYKKDGVWDVKWDDLYRKFVAKRGALGTRII